MAAAECGKGSQQWVDNEDATWLDAEHVCDVKIFILPPHQQQEAPASTPCVVYAVSGLLSTIPYFQVCLSEPWKEESSPTAPAPTHHHHRHEIILPCTDSTSSSDYVKCLLFINRQEPPPRSVDDALQFLRAADHLLFHKCADYCMAHLASFPWSDEEEQSVQQTISSMGLKPSSDLSEKLIVADDVKVYKEVLVSFLTQKSDSAESLICDFVEATFKEASEEVTIVCMSVIRGAWIKATDRLISSSSARSYSSRNALTSLFLEHGYAEKILEDFVGVSEKLLTFFIEAVQHRSIKIHNSSPEILRKLLISAVPNESDNKAVLLSNSDRAKLVSVWAPICGRLSFKSLQPACLQLFMSLPLQDPVVVAIVKKEAGNVYFDSFYKWWRSKLFKRLSRCDLVHEEVKITCED